MNRSAFGERLLTALMLITSPDAMAGKRNPKEAFAGVVPKMDAGQLDEITRITIDHRPHGAVATAVDHLSVVPACPDLAGAVVEVEGVVQIVDEVVRFLGPDREPDEAVAAIGSGGPFAKAAATAQEARTALGGYAQALAETGLSQLPG